jgi:site-specific recombinase XerD
VRIHDLRHTYASLLINNGASIYEVQQLLGHHYISMTERYAQLFPNTLQDRVNIIASAIDLDSI